jgi:cation diffusion facilitator family transporter
LLLNNKIHTARISIFSNVFLVTIKLIAGLVSGSVSILSEAIHSVTDLIAAFIAYFSVRISDQPPDNEHPYGHGKFENVSGVVEGLLILFAAGWIIFESMRKFIHQEPVDYLYLGIIVMVVSAILNFFVSRRLQLVAVQTDSIALEADALHLKTDVYTSVGVAAGILIIWITGLHFLDPVVAILVALLIVYEAVVLIKHAIDPLLDKSLPENEINNIKLILSSHTSECISYHQFRTRKSGSHKYLDFHLQVPENMSVKDAHDLCDQIEKELKFKIENLDINIHIEPCVADITRQ